MDPKQQNLLLSVIIRNPEKLVFEGKVKAVTAYNTKGIFDVLPYHANFISIINDVIILHAIDGKEQKIPLQKGVIRVFEDTVSIYLGIETLK